MKFEKVSVVQIPDPQEAFYQLKRRGAACEQCKSPLAFASKNSTLRAACFKCGAEVGEVPFQRVTTFKAALEEAKSEYEKRTREVLQAKFDHIFNYTDKEDVQEEKAAYVKAKQNYTELLQSYRKTIQFPDLDPTKYDPSRFKREAVTLPVTEGSKVRCKTLLELEKQVWSLKYKVLDGRSPISHIFPFTLRDLEIPK